LRGGDGSMDWRGRERGWEKGCIEDRDVVGVFIKARTLLSPLYQHILLTILFLQSNLSLSPPGHPPSPSDDPNDVEHIQEHHQCCLQERQLPVPQHAQHHSDCYDSKRDVS
jgi:hypothetical protein